MYRGEAATEVRIEYPSPNMCVQRTTVMTSKCRGINPERVHGSSRYTVVVYCEQIAASTGTAALTLCCTSTYVRTEKEGGGDGGAGGGLGCT